MFKKGLGASYCMDYFFIHGEFESMNSGVKISDTGAKSNWVNGLMVGIGREFRVYKDIRGTVVLLYNTLHDHETSPHPRAWQVRMGFCRKKN